MTEIHRILLLNLPISFTTLAPDPGWTLSRCGSATFANSRLSRKTRGNRLEAEKEFDQLRGIPALALRAVFLQLLDLALSSDLSWTR